MRERDRPTTMASARRSAAITATAEAELAPPGELAAAGGGYAGPLATRQGERMRPDVARAFDRMERAARAAGLGPLLQSLPHGLETIIGEEGYGLSGGQAQRVAIARAFVRDAPLLLLDEPTAHLDPATEADVLDSLRRLTIGRTVLLASHASAAQNFAGRRIVLADVQGRRAGAA